MVPGGHLTFIRLAFNDIDTNKDSIQSVTGFIRITRAQYLHTVKQIRTTMLPIESLSLQSKQVRQSATPTTCRKVIAHPRNHLINRGEMSAAFRASVYARTREILPVAHTHPDNWVP